MTIKIEASRRLRATTDRSLKSVLGIDGDMMTLKTGTASYRLKEPATEKTVRFLSTRLRGVPQIGRQGTTKVFVWECVEGMGIALYMPESGYSTLDIYDRD